MLLISISVFSQKMWNQLERNTNKLVQELEFRESQPSSFKLFSINRDLLSKKLSAKSFQENILELPTPNGVQKFYIKEASVFADALAAKFPEIRSYVGIGIDDPTARVRFSNSTIGLHAMITSGKYPMYLIDPFTKDKKTAIAYFKNETAKSKFECLVEEVKTPLNQQKFQKTSNANDGKLRTYRMALIGTAEYSQFHLTNQGIGAGATDATKKAAVLSAMNASMTRINGVFERDLGVTMQLVANNENLIFFNAATDGLTNNDISTLS